jgi:hypothetical protein
MNWTLALPEITLALRGDYVINGAESHDTAWLRIRQSSDPADFREFLARFPLSAHAPKASRRLEMLERTFTLRPMCCPLHSLTLCV